MRTGTILAHKHTLYETYAGFFRALATESFSAVRHWLHPELERLIGVQCQRNGETSFLRSLRLGLGDASQRLRLGSSQADGAGQIRTQLLNPQGEQAGSVRFVLSGDGWRIYAVEVWTAAKPPAPKAKVAPRVQPTPMARAANGNLGATVIATTKSKGRSAIPKMLASYWMKKSPIYE